MSTYSTSEAEARLREERGHLVHQLAELGASESGELRSDYDFGEGFADAAAATAERTEVIGLIDSLKGMLENVDTALGRIEDGTYGTCAQCGKEIGAGRLEVRPESTLCVDCKNKNSS